MTSSTTRLADSSGNSQPVVQSGMVVNGCRLVDKIGEGGFGQVWKAQQEHPSRMVALKLIPCEISGMDRTRTLELARKEAELRAELQTRDDIPILYSSAPYYCDQAPGAFSWVLTMEFIAGTTLDSRLEQFRSDFSSRQSELFSVVAQSWSLASSYIDYEAYFTAKLRDVVGWLIGIERSPPYFTPGSCIWTSSPPTSWWMRPARRRICSTSVSVAI